MNKVGRYFWNILISLDQLANTLLLGDPDETLSSRWSKWRNYPHDSWKWKIGYYACRALHWIDKEHCLESEEHDEGKDDLLEMRRKERKHGK